MLLHPCRPLARPPELATQPSKAELNRMEQKISQDLILSREAVSSDARASAWRCREGMDHGVTVDRRAFGPSEDWRAWPDHELYRSIGNIIFEIYNHPQPPKTDTRDSRRMSSCIGSSVDSTSGNSSGTAIPTACLGTWARSISGQAQEGRMLFGNRGMRDTGEAQKQDQARWNPLRRAAGRDGIGAMREVDWRPPRGREHSRDRLKVEK